MPKWLAHHTEEQKAQWRQAVSRSAKRSWQRGRKGNHRFPKGREAKLYARGLREGCARFYWLARCIVGYHNPTWSSAKIMKRINWITRHYGSIEPVLEKKPGGVQPSGSRFFGRSHLTGKPRADGLVHAYAASWDKFRIGKTLGPPKPPADAPPFADQAPQL